MTMINGKGMKDDKICTPMPCPKCGYLADGWIYNNGFTVRIKCPQCEYDKETTIGSGNDE